MRQQYVCRFCFLCPCIDERGRSLYLPAKPFGGETVCFNAAKTFIQQGDRISGGEKEEKQSEILQKLLHPSSEFRRFIYDSDKIHQGEESIKLRSGDSFRPYVFVYPSAEACSAYDTQ